MAEQNSRKALAVRRTRALRRRGLIADGRRPKDWRTLSLTEQERQLCLLLEHGAVGVEQTAQALGIDKYNLHTESLERTGVILRAGLTPTDIMHLRGDYTRYERRASILGARFVAASMQCSLEQLCERVYTEISHRIFSAVSQMLLEHASPYYQKHGIDDGMQHLLELQWDNQAEKGSSMLQYQFQSKAVVVGIGGPVHLFLPAAAKALDAACIIPDCAPVANALGAVTGRMTRTLSAEIRPHGMTIAEDTDEIGDFEVVYAGNTKYFAEEPARATTSRTAPRTPATAGASWRSSSTTRSSPRPSSRARSARVARSPASSRPPRLHNYGFSNTCTF